MNNLQNIRVMPFRITLFLAALFLVPFNQYAQVRLPSYPDSIFSTYYQQKKSFAESLPLEKDAIVFLGNSITDGAQWGEVFQSPKVLSRGFSGDVTAGILNRLPDIIRRKPAKVFLLIGTNDLARGVSVDSTLQNILLMADYSRQESPKTKFYVQSILPVNDTFKKFSGHMENGAKIKELNQQLKQNAGKHFYTYIDINTPFSDASGKLNTKYSNDGLHLLGEGYMLWKHLIYPYVFDQLAKPTLIPLPQKLAWNEELFPLYAVREIVLEDTLFNKEAQLLQKELSMAGWHAEIVRKSNKNKPQIELRAGKLNSPQNNKEGYTIHATSLAITMTASTPQGMFNAVQTLKQLMRDNTLVDGCIIEDNKLKAISY